MGDLTFLKILTILIFPFIGWAICGAIMMIGPKFMSMERTLVIHAIGAPAAFAVLSVIYFQKFNYTSPFVTAVIFLSFVIIVDLVLVVPVFEKSFAMFKSVLGTWIPFALIFLAIWLTGKMF